MLLVPKSRDDTDYLECRKLSLNDATWAEGPDFAPHLLYANLRLDLNEHIAEKRRLVDWCQRVGPNWSEAHIVKYLALHQSQFRDCLRWLAEDAVVDFEEMRKELGRAIDEFRNYDLLKEWKSSPEVRFLQLHAISHCDISLKPKMGPSESNEWLFSGINLGPRRPKDPIDVICWHLLYLLMRDGRVNIRECGYCEMFFRPRTKRKEYCSDLCRAKAHSKSRDEWRNYMRKYRETKRNQKVAKESGCAKLHHH